MNELGKIPSILMYRKTSNTHPGDYLFKDYDFPGYYKKQAII